MTILPLLFLLFYVISSISLLPTTTSTDRFALLSFKSLISSDPFGALSSWNDSLHYCQWRGIACSRRHPERVTALNLDSLLLAGSISPSLGNLTFLQRISLSDNMLTGAIPKEIGRLSRLQYVNISMNSLDGSIPSALGNCSNLRIISFKGNRIKGEIPPTLARLSRIQILTLRSNMLQGSIPDNLSQCVDIQVIDFQSNFLVGAIPLEFGSFRKLTQLILGYNNFTGVIPATLGNLDHLLVLDLSFNILTGSIPTSVGNLSSLLYFAVYNNNLTGVIPPILGNLPLQVVLDVSYNSLTGTIPPSLGNLSSLDGLVLARNSLHGGIPSSFGKLSYLTHLDCSEDNLSGEIPASLGQLTSLVYLDLGLNGLSGKIPSSLYNLSAMISLAINSNQLEGTLPSDIGNVLPNLQILLMYQNLLEGPIPESLSNASALTDVELGFNSFTGTIPSSLGTLQNLYWLDFSHNQLENSKPSDWSFMAALTNCTNLRVLDVGYNLLRGMMPSSIANLSTRLDTLAVGNNQISGSVPAEIGKFTNLTYLDMNTNLLQGVIPVEIGNSWSLQYLDLSDNMISGKIPTTISNLTKMNRIYLSDNELEGSIPSAFGKMRILELLNLSNNKLSGSIPKEVMKLSSLSNFLDLSYNFLNGSLPLEVGSLKNIGELDFSNNKLSGQIPSTISECEILENLHMERNLFEGSIPSSFSNLRGLMELDLSNNFLSGQIPEFLGEFPYLQYLNLSFNNFEGQVPTKGVFKNASALSLRGNTKLCGGIPELHLPACNADISKGTHHSHAVRTILLTIGGVVICLTIVLCLFGSRYWIQRSTIKPLSIFSLKDQYMKVSYNDLFKATDGFSSANIIGTGSFGSVYKGTMNCDNVSIVAVKVLNLQQHGAFQSFTSECEAMRSIRHRNLVKVLTSCSTSDHQGNDFKALVLEFMPNGSLEEWLHPHACKNRPFRSLSLIQKLNIAIDIGAALEYLHHHGSVPVVHCDLKPSNILLDNDMTAHVGDFGLAKFLIQPYGGSSECLTSTIGIKGSIGYVPPEYGMGCRPSIFGDVYSYGILLLEMFTGVSPTDDKFEDGSSLHEYVQASFPERVMDIIDNSLFLEDSDTNVGQDIAATVYPTESTRNCLISVIKYGLFCSRESPKERLEMVKIVKELTAARECFLAAKIPSKDESMLRMKSPILE